MLEIPEVLEVLPDPSSLMESMRAVGYSPETAIADLIDNSISADAVSIRVEYDASGEPYVAILDDGFGMDAAELTNAMRHGSSSPLDNRSANDLGRFGLGLKTASLSQCRKLTVVSKKNNAISARCWDIDVVQEREKWLVVVPDKNSQQFLPLYNDLLKQESGTLVVWQSLDRFFANAVNLINEMKNRMAPLYDHLSLVFHRFTYPENKIAKINIHVNGLLLKQIDPFLRANSFVQRLEGESIRLGDEVIEVKPYILPHMSRLSLDEVREAGGGDSLRRSQGFYIYRNRRLVIWGTWFRLVPKDEFFKLTRIQVDIPNSLDHIWALDIKKSAAYPPEIIRKRLRSLIDKFVGKSKRTIVFSGRKSSSPEFDALWERIEGREKTFRYSIKMNHGLVKSVSELLDESQQTIFQSLINSLAISLPLESIYADMSGDVRKSSSVDGELIFELIEIARTLLKVGLDINNIFGIDPLARYPELYDKILEGISL